MARIVKRTHTGPLKVVIEGKDAYLCRCGLSRNQPYCDSSHKQAREEDPAKLYWYDDAGTRHECAEQFPGIRTF